MQIIFIHGMNQQQQTARSLEQHWLALLSQGLKQSHQETFLSYIQHHMRMPFYGDLLTRYHLQNMLQASTLTPQTWPHFPFIHRTELPEKSPKVLEHHAVQNNLPDITLNDAIGLSQSFKSITALGKDLALRDFAVLMNYFPKLHATLLHKFLVETYLYLSNPHFIQAVHTRLHEQLHQTKPTLLIAHSLGSVIAYHFLLLHPELNIQHFITLGSPLAFRVIQAHLPQPLQRPDAISGDWLNFYSHDDFLSAFPLSQAPFDFQPAIINQQIQTSIEHPHDIAGYLTHPEVIATILQVLKKPT